MKIFTRTFLYTLALLILIALLANGLIYTFMPMVYTEQKQQELTTQADKLAKQLEASKRADIAMLMGISAAQGQKNIILELDSDKYALSMWSSSSESGGANMTVTVTSETVSGKSDSDPAEDVDLATDAIKSVVIEDVRGLSDSGSFYSSANTIKAIRSFTMEGKEGTFTMSMTLAPVGEAVNVIVSLLPISILMCIVIAIIFSLLLARAITHPIKAISEETRRMTLLDRNARCKVKTKDEIGELTANVNGLYENLLNTIDSLETELKKVAAAEKAKTDFLRAASHELKTPATAVGVIMDNMILGVGKYKNHEEWLPKCKELVNSLSVKLCDILDASRLDAISEPDTVENLETICSEVLEPYIIIARAKGLSLYMDWSASFMVTAPLKLLTKALSNVFSNAVQYTSPGGKLSVYCKGRSLIVENECVPIPEEQLLRLYEPFYRPDVSRSRDTGGNGLGLYIVETALRRLGLDYHFGPMTSPIGMRFTINF